MFGKRTKGVEKIQPMKKGSGSFSRFVKKWQKKLHFDSHSTMERFGVIVSIFAVTGVIFFGGAGWSARENVIQATESKSLYTKSFITSRTDLPGKITGVYVDESRTRALVMLGADDSRSLPVQANEYQMFMTGKDINNNTETLVGQDITGKYVVFGGNSSHMGIVLDKKDGFNQQILQVFVRINKEINSKDGGSIADASQSGSSDSSKDKLKTKGESSSKYDQFQVIFNPGAKDVPIAPLGKAGEKFNAGDVYYALETNKAEQKLRERMEGELIGLQQDLSRIDQLLTLTAQTTVDDRGKVVRLVTPEIPTVIAHDKITGLDAKKNGGQSTLFLTSTQVIPGGYDFDWRSGNVKDGYLDSITPDGMGYIDFISAQKTAANSNVNWNELIFMTNTGEPLEAYRGSEKLIKPLIDLKADTLKAWKDYYEHKSKHQVGSYGELVDLEIDLRNVETNTSINDGASVLTLR